MPRFKAVAALALFGLLFSAGSVGSQDPFRARADAESAANALPIGPSDSLEQFAPVRAVDHSLSRDTGERVPAAPAPETQAPVGAPVGIALQPEPVALLESHPAVVASLEPRAVLASAPTQRATTSPFSPTAADVGELEGGIADIPVDVRYTVAQQRLFETLPQDIQGYFDLFMYVSKSNRGPMAQRMFVFQRDSDGKIAPYAVWEVSTGREKIELKQDRKVRTTTPEGIFALDPKRMYRRYFSKTYDGAPMHYAMFYDLQTGGRQTGLAIHAAIGTKKIRRLGRRDSAGCVRLAPQHAKELFYKIRSTTQGRVPAFAVNDRGSTDRWGRADRDSSGSLILQDGYKAVLFVESYDGRDNVAGPVIAYTQ